MCGIFLSITWGNAHYADAELLAQLRARGPDSCQTHTILIEDGCVKAYSSTSNLTNSNAIVVTLTATVLALRGSVVNAQPLVDHETGSILCWNGEAWRFRDELIHGNDTTKVFASLLEAARQGDSPRSLLGVIEDLEGPFSFVFFHVDSCRLYYGRDRLGRRSLTKSTEDERTFRLSSVSDKALQTTTEVETDGIYLFDLRRSTAWKPELLQWSTCGPTVNSQLPLTGSVVPSISSATVAQAKRRLSEAVFPRVADIPTHTALAEDDGHSKVAVLFSGGLDCTLLARIAHDLLPFTEPIDLLNVAFFNPRSVAAGQNCTSNAYEACPDRITGRASLLELRTACPNRTWNFIAIDIPYHEVSQFRPLIIRLMHPHNTEMDLSIAMALFFAARGKGEAETFVGTQSTARVLLSGLGADELFGGYTRHATAFSRRGCTGLIDELELDFARIGKRNLGRDDRVISYWGKEVRYPYLDERFTKFALELPVWEKSGFCTYEAPLTQELEPGKKLLRMLAQDLDMPNVAREKKRAIQFGARTAKMEVGMRRRKGTDLLERN